MPKNPDTGNYELPPDSLSLIAELDRDWWPAIEVRAEDFATEEQRIKLAQDLGRREVVQFLLDKAAGKK